MNERLRRDLDYWIDRLAGAPRVVSVPRDRPRPAAPHRASARHAFVIPADPARALRSLAARRDTSLFVVLLAAFDVLLARYTRETDIVVGTPADGGGALVLRTDLSGDPSFAVVVDRVRRTTQEAYEHGDVPFGTLVDELGLDREPGPHPLFQTGFRLIPGSGHAAGPAVGPLDAAITLTETSGELAGLIEYATELYDASTIERFAASFRVLIDAIAADPARRMSDLPLMDDAARDRLVLEWNATERDYRDRATVHELVERHAARRPDAVAVADARQTLTYRALNERANRLAHRLRDEGGVRPDTIVAVCLPRGADLVVAALAVLKSGGAYLPLDPGYPAERLRYMLADSGAAIVITNDEPRAGPLADSGDFGDSPVRVWSIDERSPGTGTGGPVPDPGVAACAANLAYVIYTSGSTGRPKGVLVPHAGLHNLVVWHLDVYRLTPEDRVAQTAAIGFDASVWEMWPALAAGAALYVPDEDERIQPDRLLTWLADRGVTATFLPTPLAEEILRLPRPDRLALRILLTGGDTLTGAPPAGTGFELINHYGPSEVSVVTTAAPVPPAPTAAPTATPTATPATGSGGPPIGRPIDNTRVYLLDEELRPVPVGVPGELHVAGTGLARGYLRRPGLTAEKFIPNPFARRPGERLYRTGDLARYRPDGQLEFLGRTDDQVKLRGFRIELGEIEGRLRAHPAVTDAIVTMHTDAHGGRHLIGYVTRATERPERPEWPASAIRADLFAGLPPYMVPVRIVALERFPTTAHGKIDKAALPVPDLTDTGAAHQPPRDVVEELIAAIWRQELNLCDGDELGVHDGFVALGGHSLLATQIVSRVRDAFGIELPIGVVFERQTIAGLAAALREREPRPGQVMAIARLRRQIDQLSDQQVEQLIAEANAL